MAWSAARARVARLLALACAIAAPAPCLAWSAAASPPTRTQRTYRVDAGFCADVLPRMRENGWLTWTRHGCDDVHAAVRRSFDAWQHNAHVSFREVAAHADGAHAPVWVRARPLPEARFVGMVTTWTTFATAEAATRVELALDSDTCWYSDRAFCHAMHQRGATTVAAGAALGVAWSTSLVAAMALLFRPVRAYRSAARLLVWTVLCALPMVYVGGVLPCLSCHDLEATLRHEVGHVLGLHHPDDGAAAAAAAEDAAPGAARVFGCGCGAAARVVAARDLRNASAAFRACAAGGAASGDAASGDAASGDAASGGAARGGLGIMHSLASHRATACLGRDDVDAARTRFGGECGAPVWCYVGGGEHAGGGNARVAVALVYSLLLAAAVVGARNLASRAWRASRRARRARVRAPDAPPARASQPPRLVVNPGGERGRARSGERARGGGRV